MKFRGEAAALAVALTCGVVLATAAGCYIEPGSSRVNRGNYARITEGMTYGEVAAIFGGPGYFTMEYELARNTIKSYDWVGRSDYNVSVSFEDGVVARKSWWITGQADAEQRPPEN